MCEIYRRNYNTGENGILTYAVVAPKIDIRQVEEVCSNVKYAPTNEKWLADTIKIVKGNGISST